MTTEREMLEFAAKGKYPSESLTWLFTHCLAIGMNCKSDSGKWEHDIALFTSNQKTQIESLHQQLAEVQNELGVIKPYAEECRKWIGAFDELRQQLSDSQKQVAMLRDATAEAINLRIAPFRDGVKTDDDLIQADPVTRRFKRALAATEPK